MERKLPKDEKEIYCSLRPFMRFFSEEEFDNLYNGVILQKNLYQRLYQLKYFYDLGLRTHTEINEYVENYLKEYRASKTLNKSIENKSQLELRSDNLFQNEKDFIKRNNFDYMLYQFVKSRLKSDSKNSIKTMAQEKFTCKKEDIDKIAEFINDL